MNAAIVGSRPSYRLPWRDRVAGLLVLALAVIFGPACSFAQFEKGKGLKLNQPTKRANGSASTLTGSVYVYNIFVEDKTSNWTKQERDAIRARLAGAVDFIETKATDYGRKVKITLLFKEGIRHPDGLPTDPFANSSWTEEVIKQAGGVSGNELVAALKKKHQADQVLLILHVNKGATSYSLTFYDGIDPLYAAERVVCFNRYADGQATAAATYVNQILSSFGAATLFFPFDKDDTRKKRAQALFPDDVMYRGDYDLTRLNIGSYTAYRIGWLNKLAEEHKVFED